MNERTRNALVGLFVICGLIVLGGLMVIFGEQPEWLGGAEWRLRVVGVEQLRDIRPGIEVTMGGVVIGRLDAIEFIDESEDSLNLNVNLALMIKDRYSVPANAKALVYNPALGIGRGHIELAVPPGPTRMVLQKDDSARIPGEMASRLNEVISDDFVREIEGAVKEFKSLAASLRPVAKDLHLLMEKRTVSQVEQDETLTANLSTAVERLDTTIIKFNQALEHFNDVAGDPAFKKDISEIATNLREGSKHADELILSLQQKADDLSGDVKSTLASLDARVDESFTRLQPVLENLDHSAAQLHLLLKDAREGDGTVGLLIRDPRLYESAVLSLELISDILREIKPFVTRVSEEQVLPIEAKTSIGPIRKDLPLDKKE